MSAASGVRKTFSVRPTAELLPESISGKGSSAARMFTVPDKRLPSGEEYLHILKQGNLTVSFLFKYTIKTPDILEFISFIFY